LTGKEVGRRENKDKYYYSKCLLALSIYTHMFRSVNAVEIRLQSNTISRHTDIVYVLGHRNYILIYKDKKEFKFKINTGKLVCTMTEGTIHGLKFEPWEKCWIHLVIIF
jgi:hypothetical protein